MSNKNKHKKTKRTKQHTLDLWISQKTKEISNAKNVKKIEKIKDQDHIHTENIKKKNAEDQSSKSNTSSVKTVKPKKTEEPILEMSITTEKSAQTEEELEKSNEKTNKDKSLLQHMILEFLKSIRIPELKSIPTKNYNIESLLRRYHSAIIVTEKHKVASILARLFNNVTKKKHGKVTYFIATWKNYPLYIIPMRGHITEITPINEYQGRWEKTDPIELINKDVLKERIKEKDIASLIQEFSKKTDMLIIATDADEEGSNIGLEAYNIAKKVNPNLVAYRMWFLSLQRDELFHAFINPIEPKWSWAWAVQARRIIDAMVGFSSTRELTLALKELVTALRIKAFSIGRVQTPTLYLVYLREKEIREFTPRPYWSFNVVVIIGNTEISFQPVNAPYYDFNIASEEYSRVKNSNSLLITSVKKEAKRILQPTPLDTTSALTMINNILGIPSKKAMDILEDLYLNGLITYPRTETNQYPPNYNHLKNLKILSSYAPFSSIIREILREGGKIKRNGSRFVGDHLPITPIDVPKENDKRLPTKAHKDVYELILRRYLALFLDPALIEKASLSGNVNGVKFKGNVTVLIKSGFFEVFPYNMPEHKKIDLNRVKDGLKLPIKDIKPLEKRFTTPPERLTEAKLIKLMEQLGLGTKSTRPEHIETLVSRRYVIRKGRKLEITEIGFSLMEQLEKIWPEFLKPYFSAKVHILMRNVMNHELDWLEMIDIIEKDFLELFKKLRDHLQHFKNVIHEASQEFIQKEYLINCPKCKVGKMIVTPITGKKINVLKCTNCGYSLIIPKAKKYERMGIICKVCGSEILLLKKKDSTILLCPVCWKKYGPCTKCPYLNECPASKIIVKLFVVGDCCENGKLYYIQKYKMVICDSCNERYYLPKNSKNIRLLRERCPHCNLRLFSFTIPGKRRRVKYCIKCKKIF